MKSCACLVDLLIKKDNGSLNSKKVCLINISEEQKGIVDYTGLIVDGMKIYRAEHDAVINYWIISGEALFDINTLFY